MVSIGSVQMAMKKIMVSMTDEMVKALEEERKKRKLSSIPEVARQILGEYLSKKSGS
jgi:metal-responsive CopG/Arc/MetJ family transcriptional regulator